MTHIQLLVFYYITFLIIAIPMALWVGNQLHKNGHILILEILNGDSKRADSLNNLLLIGFYLIIIGFIFNRATSGDTPNNSIECIEIILHKMAWILMTLGILHFFNIYMLHKLVKKTNTQ